MKDKLSRDAFRKVLNHEVHVLRLGHRVHRDKRVTTHLALAARAFGASVLYLAGKRDIRLEKTIEKVSQLWGKGFVVEYVKNWESLVAEWREHGGIVVHLTMYGIPFQSVIEEIRELKRPVLLVVGGKKVPRKMYELADYNLSVTSQPHSEVSSLAVFLDNLFMGSELVKNFIDSKIIIVPSPRGKMVLRTLSQGVSISEH